MILALHGVAHWLRRGHFAEFFTLDGALKCHICDLGSPTERGVFAALAA